MNDTKASNAMWGGRFASGPAAVMEAINASIGFDRKLYAQDIRGAYKGDALMLARPASTEEVAETVRWLAVDAPPSATGAVIDVNGASYVR